MASNATQQLVSNCQQKPFQIQSLSDTVFLSSNSDLYQFDPATNAINFIGNMGRTMLDIAFNGNTLYGVDGNGLYRINYINGAATFIGPLSAIPNALAFDSAGVLFGVSFTPNLIKINTSTAAVVSIGLVGVGLSPDGDIAFDLNGDLFGTFNNGKIYKINPNTGAGTLVGNSGFSSIWGLTYCAGQMFAGTGGGEIMTVNTATGVASLVTNWGKTINGMASVAAAPCSKAPLPVLEPTISLRWGDGISDKLETDDVEVLCITVCNPYNNVTFTDVVGFVTSILDSAGNVVPNLPDGTPSVRIKPSNFICFGDIRPCRGTNSNCVSRELVLINRGAKVDKYQVTVELCFTVSFDYSSKEVFIMPLTAS